MISPCAYVVGLLDEVVIRELGLRRRGYECYVADPNLWVPFDDGTSFAQWLDDAQDPGRASRSSASPRRTSRATGPTRRSSTRSASGCAPARATPGSATRRRAPRSRSCSHGEQTMLDIVFEASIAEVLDDYIDDQRIKDALFGQGVIAAYGGPKDKGTASIKLMHYQGDLEGQGPVWGYVKGGMGMISFAIADAAHEARRDARLRRAGRADPARRGRRARGRHAHPRAHRDLQRRPEGRAAPARRPGRPRRLPRAAGGVEDPQPGREVQRGAERAARVDRGARRALARATRRSTSPTASTTRSAAFEACDRGEPAVGFGEIYIQTGYDPTPAPEGHHLLSVFGQYAPYELAEGDWDSRRDEVARQFIDLIGRFAPGLRGHARAPRGARAAATSSRASA